MPRRLCLAIFCGSFVPGVTWAADRGALERDARTALQKLSTGVPAAKSLSQSAAAVLVFPKITRAGLGIGGQYGDGVLYKVGKAAGYYNTSGASYGLQAGAQQFGYAMFLMNVRSHAQPRLPPAGYLPPTEKANNTLPGAPPKIA
jgi:hypothetical protein